jgi:hypothetical protein
MIGSASGRSGARRLLFQEHMELSSFHADHIHDLIMHEQAAELNSIYKRMGLLAGAAEAAPAPEPHQSGPTSSNAFAAFDHAAASAGIHPHNVSMRRKLMASQRYFEWGASKTCLAQHRCSGGTCI